MHDIYNIEQWSFQHHDVLLSFHNSFLMMLAIPHQIGDFDVNSQKMILFFWDWSYL